MPTTINYALPSPEPGDVPDVPSDMQNLADAVDTELARIDADAASLADRVTALESGTGGIGWKPIAVGVASGANFTIDLTAAGKYPSPPLWDMVRVSMRVDLDGVGEIECRVNGDSDAVYRSSGMPYDAAGNIDAADGWHFAAGLAWRIAHLSTISSGNLTMTLFHTAANPGLLSYQCTSARQSDDASTHRYTISHGSLTSGGKTASSLFFQAVSGATSFVNAWYWVEGLRMVAP